jgi:hypothetical protein
MATLAEIRAQYPQYSDMSDADLAGALHKKFYADMPREDFDKRLGLKPAEAPDPYRATARKEIDELKAKGVPVSSGGLTRRIMQGATFNAADEILAGALTPLEMIKRGTINPVEGYRHAKAREDLLMEDARKDTGLAGTIAEVGGGVVSGSGLANAGMTAARWLAPNAGLLARSGAAALDAGAMGAAAGAMEGNGLEERGKNAAQGGLLGGIAGGGTTGALGLLGSAVSPIVSNIRARMNPEGYGNSQIARAVVESGRTPQQIMDDVALATREGQGMFTVADAMGNPGQRMLSTVTRSPGRGRTDAVEFLEQRQAGQGRRVAGSLAEGFDAPRTAEQTRTRMTQARDAEGDIAYEAARQGAAPVDVSRVVARIDQTLSPGVNQLARPASGIANDSIEGALEGVRAKLTDGRSVQTNFEALQRVRADLRDTIDTAVQTGKGNRARMLGHVLRDLDAAMEAASPGFRQANRNFAQASTDIDAIATGRTAAMRGRPEDTIPAFRQLSARGQDAHRAGYADPLIEAAQTAPIGANKARPLTSDAFRDEVAAMAPQRTQAQMMRRIGRENTMFETRNAALGGSKTADNLADEAAMGIDPTFVTNILSGNWGGALRSALAAGGNALSGNTAAVREHVGRILLQRGQNANPQALQAMLDEAVRRIEMVQHIAQQLGRAGRGGAGGLAVAPAAVSGGQQR